jgi:DNA-binding response OmpR family regulator
MPASPSKGMQPHGVTGDTTNAGMSVLLLSDDATAAAGLISVFDEDPGSFLVRWVTSLEAAVEAIVENDYGCLVIDIGSSGVIGLESLDAMRSTSPDMAIVVLTDTRDDKIGVAAIERGADDYLVKD